MPDSSFTLTARMWDSMNMRIVLVITRLCVITALVYAGLLGVLYLRQSDMVFVPSTVHEASPADIGLVHEDVWLTTPDGETLHAWFLPASRDHVPEDGHGDARQVLLFFHGNSGNISNRLNSLRIFHDLGLDVFIPDYRGYGMSSGTPSEEGLKQDAITAWRYLLEERAYPPDRVIVFGRSLGAWVAASLAARPDVDPAGVILEAGFSSALDIARERYPWVPVSWLLRFELDTRAAVAIIDDPLLLMHSRVDKVVSFANAQRLLESASQAVSVEFLELKGGHNDGFLVTGADYVETLRRFLGNVLDEPQVRATHQDG